MNLDRAIKFAKTKSRHKCFRHAALVMKGKRVVAVGSNHEDHHAEQEALVEASWLGPFKRDFRGMDLLSIRVGRNGKLGMAKPCEKCMEVIRAAGIRRVYYTDSTGILQCERVTR